MDQLITTNKTIAMQIRQIANAINSHEQDKFPSKTDVNPRKHYKAITPRSGKQLEKKKKIKKFYLMGVVFLNIKEIINF